MFWVYRNKKSSWSALPPSTFVVVFAAVFLGSLRPAPAALSCGAQPEVSPVEVSAKIKGDSSGNANIILQAPSSVDLRKLVATQRRELRRKYADVDKFTLDRYLLWATCQGISKDQTLAGTRQFEEYSKVYRLLSEPIDKAAGSAE